MTTLAEVLYLQDRYGVHPLILAPLTKVPGAKDQYDYPNTPDAVTVSWGKTISLREWVESHRATNFDQFRDDKGVITYLPALAASRVDDYMRYDPNVGLYLGDSSLVLIDVDSPEEFDGWMEFCTAHGFDPGPPTIRSPGVCTPDGAWKHRNGGHWVYRVTDPELMTAIRGERSLTAPRIYATGFVTPSQALRVGGSYPQLMTNRRLGVIPPSVRAEGPYRGSLDDIRPLPAFLETMLREHLDGKRVEHVQRAQRAAHHASTYAGGGGNSRLTAWEDAQSITDVLTGWSVSGHDGECEVLVHPNASSPRSAVVHIPDCPHLDMDDRDRRLVTIWTPNGEQWINDAKEATGSDTVSIARLVAHRDYDGDMTAMKRDLGLFEPRGSFPVPTPQQVREATRIRISADGTKRTETVDVRPTATPARSPSAPAPHRIASVIRVPSTAPAPTASDVLARIAGELSPEDTARILTRVQAIMQARASG